MTTTSTATNSPDLPPADLLPRFAALRPRRASGAARANLFGESTMTKNQRQPRITVERCPNFASLLGLPKIRKRAERTVAATTPRAASKAPTPRLETDRVPRAATFRERIAKHAAARAEREGRELERLRCKAIYRAAVACGRPELTHIAICTGEPVDEAIALAKKLAQIAVMERDEGLRQPHRATKTKAPASPTHAELIARAVAAYDFSNPRH